MADGFRVCNEKTCSLPATHAVMWTEGWVYYCLAHARTMVNVGDVMGFKTARASFREMSPNEMMPDSEVNEVAEELAAMFRSKGMEDVTAERIIADFSNTVGRWEPSEYRRLRELQDRLHVLLREKI